MLDDRYSHLGKVTHGGENITQLVSGQSKFK
jgi:hypothetical protein